jgi:hypothetical protein
MSGETGGEPASGETRSDDEAVEEGLFSVNPKWFKVGFYLFILLWLAYLLVETLSYSKFEDLLFPYIIGLPVGLLILIQLFIVQYPDLVDRVTPERRGATPGDEELQHRIETATESAGSRPKAEKERYELVMMAWVTVLPFMMYYVGMGWTLIVYVFAFTWYFVRDVKLAALVTTVVTAFVYVLFIHFLSMIIWTGELGIPDPLRYLDLLF